MIDIIITSYNEPNATIKAINAIISQKIKGKYRIIVVDPFPTVEERIKKEFPQNNVIFFLDPGEGKSYALNLLFQEYAGDKKDIFIMTDGDVFTSKGSVNSIVDAFKDEKVGCVTGRPVPIDEKKTQYGYWAHVAFNGIDKVRRRLSEKEKFFECSGYLFAIRKGVIFDFPLETSEDSIIPYLFWKKGYKIKYVPEAEVYVKNPDNWEDWKKQKVRNIKAHENLNKIAPDMPRTKSFFNEIKEGALFALFQPRNLKEFWWTLKMYPSRLQIYYLGFKGMKNRKYEDGWRGEHVINSTKTLD